MRTVLACGLALLPRRRASHYCDGLLGYRCTSDDLGDEHGDLRREVVADGSNNEGSIRHWDSAGWLCAVSVRQLPRHDGLLDAMDCSEVTRDWSRSRSLFSVRSKTVLSASRWTTEPTFLRRRTAGSARHFKRTRREAVNGCRRR